MADKVFISSNKINVDDHQELEKITDSLQQNKQEFQVNTTTTKGLTTKSGNVEESELSNKTNDKAEFIVGFENQMKVDKDSDVDVKNEEEDRYCPVLRRIVTNYSKAEKEILEITQKIPGYYNYDDRHYPHSTNCFITGAPTPDTPRFSYYENGRHPKLVKGGMRTIVSQMHELCNSLGNSDNASSEKKVETNKNTLEDVKKE